MPLELNYFYSREAEQYSFYRIPKVLLTDQRYKNVSMDAKVLYGLMLDRMGLSIRNGWLDDLGRVYIYYTLEDALAALGCGKDKAVRLFKELDKVGGIGLIERKKQGQGKPTRIYVMNFTSPTDPTENTPEPTPAGSQTSENQKSALPAASEPQTSEIPKSALLENSSQDIGKAASNNTEYNHTELNDTDPSILLPVGETIHECAVYGAILHPDYFGMLPAPLLTPWGYTTRTRTLANGIYWLETDQGAETLAVGFPLWNADLSEAALGYAHQCDYDLSHGIDQTLGYQFFPRKAICIAVFELLLARSERLDEDKVDLPALMNAIWRDCPEYARYYNATANDALRMLFQSMGRLTKLPDPVENIIATDPDAGTDFWRW